ncbi:MAG: hypothetical protein AAGA87_14300 [Pseudomonadota bacterium]
MRVLFILVATAALAVVYFMTSTSFQSVVAATANDTAPTPEVANEDRAAAKATAAYGFALKWGALPETAATAIRWAEDFDPGDGSRAHVACLDVPSVGLSDDWVKGKANDYIRSVRRAITEDRVKSCFDQGTTARLAYYDREAKVNAGRGLQNIGLVYDPTTERMIYIAW